jgi:hypothetical protein
MMFMTPIPPTSKPRLEMAIAMSPTSRAVELLDELVGSLISVVWILELT